MIKHVLVLTQVFFIFYFFFPLDCNSVAGDKCCNDHPELEGACLVKTTESATNIVWMVAPIRKEAFASKLVKSIIATVIAEILLLLFFYNSYY